MPSWALIQRQPSQQPLQAGGPQGAAPVEPQPLLHQEPLVRRLQCGQGATVQRGCRTRQAWCHRQSAQGDREHLLRLLLLFRQPLGEGCHADGGSRVEILKHGQHIRPHPIAAEAGVSVAGIDPEGQAHLPADPPGVVAAEREERPNQRDAVAQGPTGPQGPQPPPMAATGQIQKQGFGPVRGRVGRQHMAATQGRRLLQQAPVAPFPGLRFAGGGGIGPLDLNGEPFPFGPGRKGVGLGCGVRPPAMVAVPKAERPAMEGLQVSQQPQEGHGVLPSREGQEEADPLRQQAGLAQQVSVEPVLVRPPAPPGRRGIGWENHSHNLACLQMSRHSSLPVSLQEALGQRRLLKVIAGLTNRDQASVERIARAAAAGGADLLDLACDPALVKHIQALVPGLPLCVSAVDPELFPAAVAAGATMVEIGNFDAFYAQGLRFEAEEVLRLTERTRALLPEVVLSVTVPHGLPLDQQEQLAIALAHAGADWIQTEGGTSAHPVSAGVLGLIEKAAPTLAATFAISRALASAQKPLPVLCASGLSAVTVPMALAAGASGVGVGSAVNRLSDELAMVAVVRALREATPAVAPSKRHAYGVDSSV
jgi:Protein of unknown function (DUF561)